MKPAHPADPAAAEQRSLTLWQQFAVSAFWFGNNLHWGALGMIVVPSQSKRLALATGAMTEGEILGWTIGLGAVVGALVPPLVGAFSDRCTHALGRRRPFVLAGTILNIAALFVFYLAFRAQSLPGYVLAWMLLGLGNNVAVGAFSGIIPDVVPLRDRGVASSWMATQQQLGTIGGFVLGGILLAAGRERDLLALSAIAAVLGVVTIITLAGTPERRLARAEPFRWSELKDCYWIDPRLHPDFGWVWITRASFTMGWWLVQPVLQFYLADVAGARDPVAAVSILGGVVLLGAIPTGIAGGVLSDRHGRKRIIYLATLVMAITAVGFAAVAALPAELRLPAVYLLAICWGFGYGAYLSVDWALGTEVLPNAEDAGKDMGVWHLSMVVPQALAAPAAGLLLRPFSHGAGHGYSPGGYVLVFLAACIFMYLAGAFIFRVKRGR